MSYRRLLKVAAGPTFFEVSTQDDMDALKNKIPGLFKSPYKLISVGNKDVAAANYYGIQHFQNGLEYPLYYVAEIFKWKNLDTDIEFPVVIIHELNADGTVRTKFFDITILRCLYDESSITIRLNSTTFNLRNIYFLDTRLSWIDSKEILDTYWKEKEKTQTKIN